MFQKTSDNLKTQLNKDNQKYKDIEHIKHQKLKNRTHQWVETIAYPRRVLLFLWEDTRPSIAYMCA
jgi:hypothetical protein